MNLIRMALFALAMGLALAACSKNAEGDKTSARLRAAEKAYYKGDFKTAAQVFQVMAERGNVRAQFFIGDMYLSGSGVPQDYAQALKWSQAAAEHNSSDAQYTMGQIYESGKGVPQDYVKAYMWYSLSASSGDEQAVRKKAAMELRMSSDQIKQANQQKNQWIESHKG